MVQASTTQTTTKTFSATTCNFVIAELERRQFSIFGSDSPYTQAESPKHTPFLSISGDTATVRVGGSPFHPMTASNDSSAVHWISHIYVQDQTGRTLFVKMLAPTSPSPAQVSFAIPTGVTAMTAYAFCNKHGLYVGPAVTHGGFGNASPAACTVDATAVRASIDLSSANGQVLAQAFVAEMWRRQSSIFEAFDPFTESVSTKHTPYIMTEGSDASVVVGKGAVTGSASDIHPMTPSTNAGVVHFVNFIYVVDEQGLVVAMTPKFPDDPSPATLNFVVPSSARSLTAYEFCNKHGLYVGPNVALLGRTPSPLPTNATSSPPTTSISATATTTTTTSANGGVGADFGVSNNDAGVTLLGLDLEPEQLVTVLITIGVASFVGVLCLSHAAYWVCCRRPGADRKQHQTPEAPAENTQLGATRQPVLMGSGSMQDALGELSPRRLELAIKTVAATR